MPQRVSIDMKWSGEKTRGRNEGLTIQDGETSLGECSWEKVIWDSNYHYLWEDTVITGQQKLFKPFVKIWELIICTRERRRIYLSTRSSSNFCF